MSVRYPGRMSWLAVGVALMMSGCASVNFNQTLSDTNREAQAFTEGQLALAQTPEQVAERARTAAGILAQPLSQNDAVRLALLNSPALQALLAQSWYDATRAAQTGRISNPVFSFERFSIGSELELGRQLSFGLLDLLTLPQRAQVAQSLLARQQLALTGDVVDQVTRVRQAWVKAVAAQQSLSYAAQVNESAEVSSELARRMQAAGNFNKLQRARQQAFYADAAAQWAIAQHARTATREELVRLLGLTEAQAALLVLPARLPDLPAAPRAPEEVSRMAAGARLDVRLAQADYEAAARAQGLTRVTSLIDVELGIRRDTVFDNAAGHSETGRGVELAVRLPIFDWGGNQRDGMNARTLAAAYRLEASLRSASSNLRESYSAYRTAWDVSKHYRSEIVPIRQAISEENLLRYNGMFIGVFELLADARDQVNSVRAAIAAEQQFWLTDAALQASVMGKPTQTTAGAIPAFSPGGGNAKH